MGHMPEPLPELLTQAEVAAWLRIPVRTLKDWRYRDVGPIARRAGRHVRYTRRDVESWLLNGRQEAPV